MTAFTFELNSNLKGLKLKKLLLLFSCERCGATCERWGAYRKGLSVSGGRYEINQLLFADDTALAANSEEKLCRLGTEFGSVCDRRKLRVNVGKSKVMRCWRYGNEGRMHVRRNGKIVNSSMMRIVLCTWDRKWQLMEDGK